MLCRVLEAHRRYVEDFESTVRHYHYMIVVIRVNIVLIETTNEIDEGDLIGVYKCGKYVLL
jgi:hypothetical protein